MTITGINLTKKGRMAIYGDGQFLFSMHPDIFALSGLCVGMELDVQELEELRLQSEVKKAKDKALHLLTYKEYTSVQLKERLERTLEKDASQLAVERMEELGLVNDEDYAVRFARDLSSRKRFGKLRVRQEMKLRGLSAELIEDALSQLQTDEEENIQYLLKKKYAGALQDEKGRARAYNGLLRMGYAPAQIRQGINSLLRDELMEEEF
ncbi:regulatory protein RecX [Youxingia wuxianensis]|uniref:Regulatory protein RecX n=1 Tax=Youxingia wuxianensis TaxID=2763678 RepID=A0A926IHD4_9FIRM|nr:regulatory protein RecX [Youxingia wuxianensis]MBC8584593.1 regulatory protein RecX [Youxingia wuxianensis]